MPKQKIDNRVYKLFDKLLELDKLHGLYNDIDREVRGTRVYILFPELDDRIRGEKAEDLLLDCIAELEE